MKLFFISLITFLLSACIIPMVFHFVKRVKTDNITIKVFKELNHCCPEKFYHKVGCSTEPASGTLTGVVG